MITNNQGMGDLNDTVQSVQSWSPLDWTVVIIGGWVLYSVVFTTKKTYDAVSGKVGSIRSRSNKRQKLLKEYNEMSVF